METFCEVVVTLIIMGSVLTAYKDTKDEKDLHWFLVYSLCFTLLLYFGGFYD